MLDLKVNIGKLTSLNPFWLASGPPTNTGLQIMRAFECGWAGAVWKTIGTPIVNVSSRLGQNKIDNFLLGINNIELISDRSNEINFKEMSEVKKKFSNHLIISSLMGSTKDEWKKLVNYSIDSGADAIEMNLSCPHGMSERGMGASVGQSPNIIKDLVSYVVNISSIPVFAKLTPNITNILDPYFAAYNSGAYGVSLINTVNSIIGVNLETMIPYPNVGKYSTHGGYCGSAVKPIALYMLAQISKYGKGIPILGIGGISNWSDSVEFLLLGASVVQICTAVMKKGYRIIDELISGLSNYLIKNNLFSVNLLKNKSIEKYKKWEELDKNFKVVAKIDSSKCIKCNLCYSACYDGAHQCINYYEENNIKKLVVESNHCIGCNLCKIVCPIEDCITMKEI